MTSSLLIIMIAWLYGYSSIWGPLLVAVLWLGLTVWGVFDMRLRYFGKIWYKAPNNRHQEIALTFDDGPTPYTSQVLDLLDAYEMRATFFCIGKQIDRYPDIARKILAKGHSIGNHSYSHAKNIGFFSSQEMEREIRETDLALAKATQSNGSLYRPPFGVTNPKVIKACLAQKTYYRMEYSFIRYCNSERRQDIKPNLSPSATGRYCFITRYFSTNRSSFGTVND